MYVELHGKSTSPVMRVAYVCRCASGGFIICLAQLEISRSAASAWLVAGQR